MQKKTVIEESVRNMVSPPSLLQATASSQTRVVLEDVQTRLSGTYMCEVTVTPDYFALMEYANMTVIGEVIRSAIFRGIKVCSES